MGTPACTFKQLWDNVHFICLLSGQDLESSARARAKCVGGVAVLPPALGQGGQGGAVLPPALGQGGKGEDRERLLVREARQGEINHKYAAT